MGSPQFSGWSVLVTGGASGIGRATALSIAEEGGSVTIADLNDSAGAETVAAIQGAGGKAQYLRTDVTNDAAVAAAVAAAETFGPLRGAVNAAGMPMCGKRFHELDDREFDRNVEVNLRGVFLSMRHELSAMLRHRRGSIVNIASTAATVGLQRGAEYCASKAGVLGLTRAAAADYVTDGIRVNAILPGGTLTPMLQVAIDQDPHVAGVLAAVHPMNRLAEPSELASAIRWLLSDGASFCTGLTLPVDGGQGGILPQPGKR